MTVHEDFIWKSRERFVIAHSLGLFRCVGCLNSTGAVAGYVATKSIYWCICRFFRGCALITGSDITLDGLSRKKHFSRVVFSRSTGFWNSLEAFLVVARSENRP